MADLFCFAGSVFWLFSPSSPLGRKVIVASWIFPAISFFLYLFNLTTISTFVGPAAAIFCAYKWGIPASEKVAPTADGARMKFLVIGIALWFLLMIVAGPAILTRGFIGLFTT